MGTEFSKVYERFLSNISDYDHQLNGEDEDMMGKALFLLLMKAVSKLPIIHNDFRQMDVEEMKFESILHNVEMEYIASQMVVEWLEPQINNTILTRQYFGTKDDKYYSQANHLDALIKLRDKQQIRTQQIARDEGYNSWVRK